MFITRSPEAIDIHRSNFRRILTDNRGRESPIISCWKNANNIEGTTSLLRRRTYYVRNHRAHIPGIFSSLSRSDTSPRRRYELHRPVCVPMCDAHDAARTGKVRKETEPSVSRRRRRACGQVRACARWAKNVVFSSRLTSLPTAAARLVPLSPSGRPSSRPIDNNGGRVLADPAKRAVDSPWREIGRLRGCDVHPWLPRRVPRPPVRVPRRSARPLPSLSRETGAQRRYRPTRKIFTTEPL